MTLLQVCGPHILLCMAPHLQWEVEIDFLVDLPLWPIGQDTPLITTLTRCHRKFGVTINAFNHKCYCKMLKVKIVSNYIKLYTCI